MNKATLTKWVEALESGKFKQGTGSLSRVRPGGHVSYCCLGVACELSKQEVLLNPRWEKERNDRVLTWGLEGCEKSESEQMPLAIQDHYGLNPGEQEDMIEANDAFKLSFKEIAEQIRFAFDL